MEIIEHLAASFLVSAEVLDIRHDIFRDKNCKSR